MKRLIQLFRNETKIEPLFKGMCGYTAETFCEQLCVAKLAARADLRAAADWIPRRVRPLDGRAIAHGRLVYALFVTKEVTAEIGW